jgi:anti-sigma regulatory factor (Ser/Thr protein kinase)
MQRSFKRALEALDDVFVFLEEALTAAGADTQSAYAVNFAVEEFFTNMVKYEPGGALEVSISVERDGDRLIVRMVDGGVQPFDVTSARMPNLSDPLEKRPVGGLGIHISRELLDSVAYTYENGQSTITFVKTLGA